MRVAPRTIRALYLQQGIDNPEVVQAAKSAGLSFTPLAKADFAKLAGDAHAQGVLAEVSDFHYASLEELLAQPEGGVVSLPLAKAAQPEPRPILFLLDRLTDPQNLGAILRTMACFGNIALVIPKHDSVEVTEAALRVACGGENYVPVARVTNLVQASETAKKAGYWIVGTSTKGGTPLQTVQWPWPLAVLLGSEGTGIRPGLIKHLEMTVTLPMPGAVLSFNVATAAALIAYEITRHKLEKK